MQELAALRKENASLKASLTQGNQASLAQQAVSLLLRLILQETTDAVYVKDLQGRYLMINAAGARFLGKSEVDVIGKVDTDLYALETARRLMDGELRIIHAGTTQTQEEAVTVEGVTRAFLVTKGVCRDHAGKIVGLYGIARDITERKQAEAVLVKARDELSATVAERTAELRHAVQHLQIEVQEGQHARDQIDQLNIDLKRRVDEVQTLLDVLPIAIGIAEDPQCRRIRTNHAFAKLLGLPPEANASKTAPAEEIPRTFKLCRNGQEIPPEQLSMQRATAEGVEVRDMEEEIVRNDGTKFDVLAYAAPLFDEQGKVRGSIGAFVDITAHKRLEAVQQRFIALVENSPLAVIEWNQDFRVCRWSDEAVKVFGWLSSEVLGKQAEEWPFVFAEDVKAFHWFRARLLEGTERRLVTQLRNYTKTGAIVHCEWYSSVMFDSAGRVESVLSLVLDDSKRKQLEEQLFQAQKMESIGQLAGGIAHHFNNLLTVVLGSIELVESGLPPANPARHYCQYISNAAQHGGRLTAQLLAFARKQMTLPKVMDLNALIQESSSLLNPLIGEHIELVISPMADLGKVLADANRLQQCLLHLVLNARDAMPDGGQLKIETANLKLGTELSLPHEGVPPGDYVKLTVTDTGTGMNENVKAHLFEPFFTTKEIGKGTGLGLASTYGSIRQMGGHIEIQSELGRGTSVKVYLPRFSDPSEAPTAAATSEKSTILLVEDDAEVRSVIAQNLRAQGFEVLEAGNGVAALALAAPYPRPIHLLLTDVVMPQMGGRRLAEELRAARPDIKVLFMSGHPDDTFQQIGKLGPNSSFLRKPYAPAALLVKVRELLAGQPE